MKAPWLLIGVLLAMCLVIGAAAVLERNQPSVSGQHPKYKEMQHTQPQTERRPHVVWLGVTFGVLEITFFVCCLAFGIRRADRLGGRKWAFIAGGILYVAIFVWMTVAYEGYLRQELPPLFFAFPLPTALMVYGLWGAPLLFVALYVVCFDRWVMTVEDLERFEKIVQARRRRENTKS